MKFQLLITFLLAFCVSALAQQLDSAANTLTTKPVALPNWTTAEPSGAQAYSHYTTLEWRGKGSIAKPTLMAQTDKQLPEYTCRVGENDFRPKTVVPDIYWMFGGKWPQRAAFQFTKSCWYDWMLPTGTQDQDIHDWSYKLFGISPLLEPNNKNGLMLAARCAKDSFMLEVCIYQNVDKAFFVRSVPIVIDTRVVYRLYVQWTRKIKDKIHPIIWATDRQGNQLFVQEVDPIDFKWQPCKAIWLWHGGENNSEGEHGGPASQEITIFADKF